LDRISTFITYCKYWLFWFSVVYGVWGALLATAPSSRMPVHQPCSRRSTTQDKVSRIVPSVCACVLREDLSDWFELDVESPYMRQRRGAPGCQGGKGAAAGA